MKKFKSFNLNKNQLLFPIIIVNTWFAFGNLAASAQLPLQVPNKQALIFQNPTARKHVDLSGDWNYSIDPYRVGQKGFHGGEVGEGAQRYNPQTESEYLEKHPFSFVEQNMEKAPKMKLPGAWNAQVKELRYYDGLVWFRRHFDNIGKANERAFLNFEAANYKLEAWVNGKKVGLHEGGFTSFAFEITEFLKEHDNQITISVDCKHDVKSIPPPITDWDQYCGINAPISVVYTPQTFISEIKFFQPPRAAQYNGISIRTNGPTNSSQEMTVSIPELGDIYNVATGANGTYNFYDFCRLNAKKWSPENPKLYEVIFKFGDDELHEHFGCRKISTRNWQILLNDKPIFLKGISIHAEEFGENPMRDMSDENVRKLFKIIKEDLGANFVRLAHYPYPSNVLRIADEMGLLVWAEIPVYWQVDFGDIEKGNKGAYDLAEFTLNDMIKRDFNHPSVIIWSVGNETPISPQRNRFMFNLIDYAQGFEDGRLISAALMADRKTENGKTIIEINDPLASSVDVMAVNTYNGWYSDDELKSLPSFEWRDNLKNVQRPLILSEFGADAKFGVHDPARKMKFSEEYQEDYYKYTLQMADNVWFLAGMSPWILKDFQSPRRQHPVYQEGWNRKGLIDEKGNKKRAFYILENYYKKGAIQ